MPRIKNPLDALFSDIKRELLAEEKAQSRLPKPPAKPVISPYANPMNWTPRKAILLVHHEEGPIGIFREYLFKNEPGCRRLMPAPLDETFYDQTELVFGDWWLHPRNQAPIGEPDSEAETQAIEARFYELLEEFLE